MDSKLNYAIMLRSKLRNKFLKSRSNKDDRLTRNNLIYALVCCIRIKNILKFRYKTVAVNKMFRKTMAPLFSNKSKASAKVRLPENEKLILIDQECA